MQRPIKNSRLTDTFPSSAETFGRGCFVGLAGRSVWAGNDGRYCSVRRLGAGRGREEIVGVGSAEGGFGIAGLGGEMVNVNSARGSHLSISSSRANEVCELIFRAAHKS